MIVKDLKGQKFGNRIVLERGHNTESGKSRWWVLCNCGNKTLLRPEQIKKSLCCKSCRDKNIGDWAPISAFQKWKDSGKEILIYEARTNKRFSEYCRELQLDFCWRCRETGQLFVDHDHDTMIIRGLLCVRCNMIEGLLWADAKQKRNELYDLAFGGYIGLFPEGITHDKLKEFKQVWP